MVSPPPDSPPPDLPGRIFDALFAEGNLAYARLSAGLQVIDISPNFAELLGYPRPLTGQDALADLIPEFIGAEPELARVLSGKVPEYRLSTVNRPGPDGRTDYLDFLVTPLDIRNPGAGLILIVADVTPTGQLEQLLIQDRNELRLAQAKLARANAELDRLNRVKSLFLAVAAHDLRAPLAAITGYAGLARSELADGDPSGSANYLAIIEQQAGLLDRSIDDLLDLDGIEAGRLAIRPRTCELDRLVKEVAQGLTPQARQAGLELSLHLPSRPSLIWADPRRVQQILYNLLNNALKYTPTGGQVQVCLRAEPGFGVFTVQDNGYGIPPEAAGHLFELYYRSEGDRQTQVRGAGLGLYIVKHLVDAQGGAITVANPPGGGTAFTVFLPSADESSL